MAAGIGGLHVFCLWRFAICWEECILHEEGLCWGWWGFGTCWVRGWWLRMSPEIWWICSLRSAGSLDAELSTHQLHGICRRGWGRGLAIWCLVSLGSCTFIVVAWPHGFTWKSILRSQDQVAIQSLQISCNHHRELPQFLLPSSNSQAWSLSIHECVDSDSMISWVADHLHRQSWTV